MNDGITINNFIYKLWENFFPHTEKNNLIYYGRTKGWIDDYDERNLSSFIDRRTAAKIIHLFIRIELKIRDLDNINMAKELTDLYTCRVCSNHIAQAYLRHFFIPEEIEYNGEIIKIFNHLKMVSILESEQIIEKIKNLV